MKRQPSKWEKISANDMTDKGLTSEIYKHLMPLSMRKQPSLKHGQKT